jgi:vacuolar-type H+-ATPase subunit I/STV1
VQGPLLTNDAAGALKLLAALGTFATAIILGFWKIMSSKLTQDNTKLKEQVDGVGQRIDAVKESDTKAHTKIDELIRRADVKDSEIRAVTQDIGRLEAKVDQTLTQGTDNKIEIIGEFQRIATEVRAGFHALDVKVETMVAVAAERERVRNLS